MGLGLVEKDWFPSGSNNVEGPDRLFTGEEGKTPRRERKVARRMKRQEGVEKHDRRRDVVPSSRPCKYPKLSDVFIFKGLKKKQDILWPKDSDRNLYLLCGRCN